MSRRAALLSLALVAGGLLPAAGLPARALEPVSSTASAGAGSITVAQAIANADRILATLRDGDANARYNQFSDDLKRISSPSMVAATMKQQPRLLSWRITQVQRGLSTTAVDAELRTAIGQRQIQLILNNDGKLAGYYLGRTDQPAASVALAFVKAVSGGQFISASSFLSPALASDLTPAVLQERWQSLQRLTGNYVATEGATIAESTPDQKLVLVTTRFNRLTDRLFVILDRDNRIIGVDVPRDAAPQAVIR
ncbi:MAG: DUF3887 domain-containing protein [Cyanobacteriota bacterium]